MAEYMDKQKAADLLDNLLGMVDDSQENDYDTALKMGIEALKADVQPVRHGQFIGISYDGYADGSPVYYEWKCSECGFIFEDEEPTFNFCPNCGSRMDGEQNGSID